MAQGSTKGLKAKAQSGGRKKSGQTKKGKRVVPPKDKQRIQQLSQQKQLSSKINNSIEKQMVQAASAGKLTIMRGAGDVDASAAKGKGKGKDKA